MPAMHEVCLGLTYEPETLVLSIPLAVSVSCHNERPEVDLVPVTVQMHHVVVEF